jgi:hypothetical protein
VYFDIQSFAWYQFPLFNFWIGRSMLYVMFDYFNVYVL